MKEQGHQPLRAALQAPGVCYKNKKEIYVLRIKIKEQGHQPLGGGLRAPLVRVMQIN
jgi:hypothetical protein